MWFLLILVTHNRLDKFWSDQEVFYDYNTDLDNDDDDDVLVSTTPTLSQFVVCMCIIYLFQNSDIRIPFTSS